VESGEGMGGGVECGEGLGVQAVMRDGAVHSGAGNEGWLRDGGGGGSSGIYLRDWADTDDRERLYRSYSTLSVRPQRTRTCHPLPESLIITTEELVQLLLYLRGGIAFSTHNPSLFASLSACNCLPHAHPSCMPAKHTPMICILFCSVARYRLCSTTASMERTHSNHIESRQV
jgi:hypothetical protein